MVLDEYTMITESEYEGSYGLIKFATNTHGRRVAVKFNLDASDEGRLRFVQENEILYIFTSHNGVVNPITSVFEESYDSVVRQAYIMERAESSFHDYVLANQNDDNDILQHIISIAETIDHVHTCDYLHRDLHAHNVLVFWDDNQNNWVSKICDFGRSYNIIKPLGISRSSAWGDTTMPPEYRFELDSDDIGDQNHGDYYALGLLLKDSFTYGSQEITRQRAIATSIEEFKNTKVCDVNNYRSVYNKNQRLEHYKEWCELYEASIGPSLYLVTYENKISPALSKIFKVLSNVNYTLRTKSLDPVITQLKGI